MLSQAPCRGRPALIQLRTIHQERDQHVAELLRMPANGTDACCRRSSLLAVAALSEIRFDAVFHTERFGTVDRAA